MGLSAPETFILIAAKLTSREDSICLDLFALTIGERSYPGVNWFDTIGDS